MHFYKHLENLGQKFTVSHDYVTLPGDFMCFEFTLWILNTVVSRCYDITGIGNIYRNIRTIVITVKPSREKQRQWWALIQVHV